MDAKLSSDILEFLEIFLSQDKKESCKKFVDNNIENLNITDFSLHSIGVIKNLKFVFIIV